mmetsp:Transcript_15331/g.53439  ORF Transcript_15331/g.53439 Transcript_15331/m.53439 type:complete len:211 (+) Transcript_15331:141-773(+)
MAMTAFSCSFFSSHFGSRTKFSWSKNASDRAMTCCVSLAACSDMCKRRAASCCSCASCAERSRNVRSKLSFCDWSSDWRSLAASFSKSKTTWCQYLRKGPTRPRGASAPEAGELFDVEQLYKDARQQRHAVLLVRHRALPDGPSHHEIIAAHLAHHLHEQVLLRRRGARHRRLRRPRRAPVRLCLEVLGLRLRVDELGSESFLHLERDHQ